MDASPGLVEIDGPDADFATIVSIGREERRVHGGVKEHDFASVVQSPFWQIVQIGVNLEQV